MLMHSHKIKQGRISSRHCASCSSLLWRWFIIISNNERNTLQWLLCIAHQFYLWEQMQTIHFGAGEMAVRLGLTRGWLNAPSQALCSRPFWCFSRGGERCFWTLWCCTKTNDMFVIVLAKQEAGPKYKSVSSSCRVGRSNPAVCYDTPSKGLRICSNAVGVDHRITVSVAVNQGINFYLGFAKPALVSLTTTPLW